METLFIEDTINVYRTELFIVVQNIGTKFDGFGNDIIFSFDTFYSRNQNRDQHYEHIFRNRQPINGKRIKATMHTRTYVD